MDPRQFGIDYLPPGYVYSIRAGKIVDQNDYADWLLPTIAGAGMTLGATGLIPGFGGLAGDAASQVPQLGNLNGTLDAIEGAMRAYGARPALLIASRQDPYAARSSRELAKEAPGVRELQWSELGAHGTALLSREPDLVQALVDWFRRTLA